MAFFELTDFAMYSTPLGEDPTYRTIGWLTITGIGVVAASFISASIIALRNRKVAALILLASMPIAAFCLTTLKRIFFFGMLMAME